jgi:thiamine biosynthesis lipoprotein ApbE
VVPIPINVSFDAHDNEVDIDRDFLDVFENAQTNQDVDLSTLHDAITNVIKRWGFGLEVEHSTQT